MRFAEHLVLIRGGGDLGSGAAYQLHMAGFPVIVTEVKRPKAIRRAVSFAGAVESGEVVIESITGVRAESAQAAVSIARTGKIAVLVSEKLPELGRRPAVIVDARLAKRNIDTAIDQAPLTIGLGPGFTAGVDCDLVIETQRGHRLGRVIGNGSAQPDTGVPGEVGGESTKRVVRAPSQGVVHWAVSIGDTVEQGRVLGSVGAEPVRTPISGVVRGLISNEYPAEAGLKIADIDPRGRRAACFEISDKARLVGSGVVEAVLSRMTG